MKKHMPRRTAIALGLISAGSLIPTAHSKKSQELPTKASNPPFLTPWSPPSDLERDLKPGTTPVRLAARTKKTDLNYPKDMSITETVKRIRDMGYTSTCTRYGMSGNPWLDASDAEVRELKEALKKYDVTFFGFRAVTNNIHPDLSERRKIHRYIIEQCEAAERLGGKSVTTGVGSCSAASAIAPHRDNWTWETWKLSVKVIKQLLKDTAGMNVELGIEALNMTNINNPRAHLQLIEDVADPRCKCVLDVSNMISLATYFHSTELIDEVFDLLGEDIVGCHAKDFKLNNRMYVDLVEVPPGKGIQDYETYLVRLSRLKWSRTLMLEHFPENEYPAAKAFIEKTAEDVGVKIYG